MLTDRLDLRTGKTAWAEETWNIPPADPLPTGTSDIAIVGGGITGVMLAERLSAEGRSIVLLDRRSPGSGSTAASTAQLMWAMDVPFCQLAHRIGEAEAARRWQRVYKAVRALDARIDTLGLDVGKQKCPTVYLAGRLLDECGLEEELELHRRHGLPSEFLDAPAVAERFGIAPRAALISTGGFSVDPVRLTHALLAEARSKGARACYPVDVTALAEDAEGVTLTLGENASLRAQQVILASGYERAALFLPPAFSLLSTFVIATRPKTAPPWREEAMIWEASDPYIYVRADSEGRVIAGGEDVELCDPRRRDELLYEKAGMIAARLAAILDVEDIFIDRRWSATFGSSPDGLPAIGPAANMHRVWLAAGYGGNGIAFSAMAAEILANLTARRPDDCADAFDPYRFQPGA